MTNLKRPFLTLLVGLIGLFALPQPLLARKATLSDITVANSDTELLLFFTVKNCFTDEIVAGIHNGIPATFTFYVELYRINRGWPDRKITAQTFNHTLTYDNLKEEYRIVLSERNQEIVTTALVPAQKQMAEVNGFRVITLEQLAPDTAYRLRIKAKLAKKTLPLYFHYLIPFSSLWDFETGWHSLEFSY